MTFIQLILQQQVNSQYSFWLQTGRPGDRGSISGRGKSLCVETSSEAHPASCPVNTGVLSPGVKRGRGVTVDHLPPSIAEVKNE